MTNSLEPVGSGANSDVVSIGSVNSFASVDSLKKPSKAEETDFHSIAEEGFHQGSDPVDVSKKKPGKFTKLVRKQFYIRNRYVTGAGDVILLLGLSWAVLYLFLNQEVYLTGSLFKLISLCLLAYLVGTLVSFIRLPALLGMLITGVFLKSIGFFSVSGVYEDIIVVSRNLALTVILIKAGLGLDPKALKKNLFTVVKLGVCPCVAEALAAAVISHYMWGFDWLWGLLMGFLLSPISPAVVVPTLLKLKEQKYGEDKGISTMVIAASSIDDIFSISMFGVFYSMVFEKNVNITALVMKGPEELVMGLAMGIFWGWVCSIFPNKNDSLVSAKRCVMIGLGGVCMVLGTEKLDYEGAGPLGTITAAFTAACAWRAQGWQADHTPVADCFSTIWLIVQPILFGLIGSEINLTTIDWSHVGTGLILVFGALAIRVCSCFAILLCEKLNMKEILFVNLAWLPKATVQAALSAKPLDRVNQDGGNPDDLATATLLLTTAVVAILVTAPLGSIGISLSGPALLSKPTLLPGPPKY